MDIKSLNKEDFAISGWENVLKEAEGKESQFYSTAFYEKSQETSDDKSREIFLLIANLMNYRLTLQSPDTPFASVDRFNEEHLDFFSKIVDEVFDDEIKSRMADLLWLRTKNHKMAEIAVESYLKTAQALEDFEHWPPTQKRIERALQLASMLDRKGKLYQKVLNQIFDLLKRCNGNDPNYLSAELMRLLLERREGDPKKYAQLCSKLALSAERQNDFQKARRYWETKVSWHFQDRDDKAARSARLRVAATYEKESDFNLENRKPKYLMASHPIEQAIIAYQKAGDSHSKIEKLKLRLREYQQKGVEEMIPISGGPVDISQIVIQAEKAVSGKSFFDSLQALILLSSPNNVSTIRKRVEENRKKYMFSSLMPNKLFSSSGLSVGVQSSSGEDAVLADMFQYATHTYEISVKGFIEPARYIILLEHPTRVFDIYDLLMNHPFIPQDREFIVARGLHSGLNGDFLTAIHFLIPQIEESIRHILIQCGIAPSSFKADGTQDEYNLNQFLREKRFTDTLDKILGEDLMFDFRCALIERFGANLRNSVAHGLLTYGGFYSSAAVYFWWLALRFYLFPIILNKEREEKT